MVGSGADGELDPTDTMDVRVLGPVEAIRHGVPVPLKGPRQQALLASLALRAGQVVSTERLAEDLWGETPPAGAAATLRTYVSHLRTAFGDHAGVVVARKPGYVLDAPATAIDAGRFEATAAEGRRLGGVAKVEALRAALAMWRGPVMTGLAVPSSLEGRVTQLEELRLAVAEDCIEAEMALGRHAVVVGELESLIAESPLRERLRELLMLALYRAGRQADALRAFQAARAYLGEELGIEPGPRLREMEAAILRHDPSLGGAVEPPRVVVPPPPAPGSSSLIGRGAELAHLRVAVQSASRGVGQAVLVLGEAGIGKTKLLDALAEDTGGARVVRARCDEGAGTPSFWPWVQVLRSLLANAGDDELRHDAAGVADHLALLAPGIRRAIPEVEALPDMEPEAARFLLFDAVTSFLSRQAARRPLLVLIDDVQWADVPSVLLLSFIARRVRDAAVTVVATCRDDEVGGDSALGLALGSLAALPDVTRVALHGLSEAEVGEVLAASSVDPGMAAAVWERTGGNPFFVVEVARAVGRGDLSAAVPEGVRAVVRQRLARLSGEARAVLDVAAVAGRDFAVADVERAAGVGRDEVMRAVAAGMSLGVVEPVEGSVASFRFDHDLLRETIYDAIPVHERMRMHGRVAAAIETADPTGRRLREISLHLYLSAPVGDADKAVDYLLRSADEAAAALAYEDAVLQAERALELLDLSGADDVVRTDVLLRLGDARWRAGQADAARDAFRRAADLARGREAGIALALAALGYGATGVTTGLVDGLLVFVAEEALELLGEQAPALRARVLARLAMELYFSPDFSRAAALADEAVSLGRATGDRRALGEALAARHFCLRGPDDLSARLAVGAELLALAEAAGDAELTLRARHGRVGDFLEMGDIDGFDAERAAYAGLADALHQRRYQGQALAWFGLRLLLEGRYAELEPVMHEAFELGQTGNADAALQWFGVQLASMRREQGRHSEVFDALVDIAGRFSGAPAWRCPVAVFLCETDRLGEAREIVASLAKGDFEDIPRDVNWLTSMALLGLVVHYLGDAAWAARIRELLSGYADRFVVVGGVAPSACYGSVAYYLGLVSETMGDVDAAVSYYEHALAANGVIGATSWTAHAEGAYGSLLLRSGRDVERGAALVASARSSAAALGMHLLLTRLRTLEDIATS